MAATKRTEGQREEDLTRLSEWYLKGRTQVWMATRLKLTRQQIAYDLQTLQDRWEAAQVDNINKAKIRELQRIDFIEQTYWQAWRRSLQTRQKTKTARMKSGRGSRDVAEINKEDSYGDPRYLTGVQWCVEQRCKIIGLNAPTEGRLTGPNGGALQHNFNTAETGQAVNELQEWMKQHTASALNSSSAPLPLPTL